VHPRHNPRLFHGIGFICLLWALNAPGGPPLLTDDPDTPGPNHWEINIAMTSLDEAHSWQLGTPLFDINYGVGDHIQLKYQAPVEVVLPPQGGALGGMDNSLLGVKWRFLDQTNGSWLEISTYPQLEFLFSDSAVRRLQADNGDNLLLPIEVEHKFEKLTVYAEGGYMLNSSREPEVLYGIAAEYECSEKFSLMGELYGGYGVDFQESGLAFNLGFRRALTGHVALIGSAGRSITGPEPSRPVFMSYLGVQLTY
jgi:hypothetical protein